MRLKTKIKNLEKQLERLRNKWHCTRDKPERVLKLLHDLPIHIEMLKLQIPYQ